jgi:glycosyltransferase involved in cell wall biosynthesis
MGKGAALRTALPYITTPYFIIQDADLEYDPREYSKILKPLIEDRADVVYGSRFVGGGDRRVLRFWHSMGNKLLTFISNCFTNLYLTDMATCYKCFRSEIIKSLDLRENRFGIDPEITAKIAKKNIRIVEVGISYTGRSYDEGKKIGIRDGFRHIFCMIVYRFRK